MRLCNDVVAEAQSKTGSLTGSLGCKEGLEDFVDDRGRYAFAVVRHADLNMMAGFFRRDNNGWFVRVARPFCRIAFSNCVKGIGDKVKDYPAEVLRYRVHFANGRIEFSFRSCTK